MSKTLACVVHECYKRVVRLAALVNCKKCVLNVAV